MISEANLSDIQAIMRLERVEGYADQVGRWSKEQHKQELAKTEAMYLLLIQDEEIVGFVLLQGVNSPDKCVHLKRIAVASAGRGIGSELLRQTLRYCFEMREAHRVELTVFIDNERARAAYIKVGFREEGILREVYKATDGKFRSMRMMSILRPEWVG